MQAEDRAIDGGRGKSAGEDSRPSPVKVFVALLVVLGIVIAVVLLTRSPEPAPPATGSAQPADYSLTNAEAIARFKELDALRRQAYEERDPNLVPMVFTAESAIGETVDQEIRQLKEDHVLSKTKFFTKRISVIDSTSTLVRVRQVVVIDPKVVSEQGREVTTKGRIERQVIEWTLQRELGQWLIDDAVIVAAAPIRGGRS